MAGATPAALAGPEVLGYARIAGVPVAGMRRILAVRRAEFVVAMP